MRTSISSLVLGALVFGCGGKVDDEGAVDPGDAMAPALCSPEPSYTPASFTPAEVAAAKAACGAPHGAVYTPTTYAQYAGHFLGAWYLCSVSSPDAGRADLPAASVIFTADGAAQFLGDDGDGGLVAIPGLADEGTYCLEPQCGDQGVDPTYACSEPEEFYLSLSLNNSESEGVVAGLFETSPARLEIQDQPYSDGPGNPFAFWYVPMQAD